MSSDSLRAICGNTLGREALEQRRVLFRAGRIEHNGEAEETWHLSDAEILVPGFHDHHSHLIDCFVPERGPQLHGIDSREAALDEVRRWLRENPGKTKVLGDGWDDSSWEDSRPLLRVDLDAIDPHRPIALRRVCGHLATLNSAGWSDLEPEGREADSVNGIVVESIALELSQLWPPSFEDLIEGAMRGQERAASLGVTGIDEMGYPETYEAFRRLQEENKLFLDVRHYFPLGRSGELIASGLTPDQGEGRLWVAGFKGFLDGSIGARTAAIDSPYEGSADSGMFLWGTDDLNDAVRGAASSGFAVTLHAIGLKAVDQALTAYELAGPPEGGRRHRIEHAEQLDDALLKRGSAAGVCWSMQPNFTARWQGKSGLYEKTIGPDRTVRLNRFRSALMNGPLLFGSDIMPMGPLYGIVGALNHPDRNERLDPYQSLWAYSKGGLSRSETKKPFEPGKPADLVVLRIEDRNLDRALREGRAEVVWTSARGEVTFSDTAASAPPSFREQS